MKEVAIGVSINLAFRRPSRNLRNEAALVEAAVAGDGVAFDRLIRLHEESLRSFIGRRVDRQDRDDVFQETCLAAWEGLRAFRRSAGFRSWLIAICMHKIGDHYRGSLGIPQSSSDIELAMPYAPDGFHEVEIREALRPAWEQLPAEQRQVLRLYYEGGLTLAEIAALEDRNLNTVKYQFYSAHERVARHFAPGQLESLLPREVRP